MSTARKLSQGSSKKASLREVVRALKITVECALQRLGRVDPAVGWFAYVGKQMDERFASLSTIDV